MNADAPEYDPDDYDPGSDDCWQCGGEGYYADCDEEWACADPEGGCDLCTRRCEVCNPRKAPAPNNNTPTPLGGKGEGR